MLGLFRNTTTQARSNQLTDAITAGALLVDVRTEFEFAEGSVPGAINIPLDTVAYELDKFKSAGTVIVCCRSGNRSSMAKAILAQNGINNVIDAGTWQHVNTLVNG